MSILGGSLATLDLISDVKEVTLATYKGEYNLVCEGLDGCQVSRVFLPKEKKPLAIIAYPAKAMALYDHGLDHKFVKVTRV